MFCPKCGAQNDAGATFCARCGAPLPVSKQYYYDYDNDRTGKEAPVAPPPAAEPVYVPPVYEQPVYEQPVYQQPVYVRPVYQQPPAAGQNRPAKPYKPLRIITAILGLQIPSVLLLLLFLVCLVISETRSGISGIGEEMGLVLVLAAGAAAVSVVGAVRLFKGCKNAAVFTLSGALGFISVWFNGLFFWEYWGRNRESGLVMLFFFEIAVATIVTSMILLHKENPKTRR